MKSSKLKLAIIFRMYLCFFFLQRIGHGAQCGGRAAGRETVGTAAGKGSV